MPGRAPEDPLGSATGFCAPTASAREKSRTRHGTRSSSIERLHLFTDVINEDA